MSARLRLAPALLVALLGVGLALHMSPSGAGSTVNPAPTSPVSAVGGVAITVADMDRSVAFYSTVLFFEKVSDVQTSGASIDRLLGVTGARVRIVTMRLGAERIELVEYLAPRDGRPYPRGTMGNDLVRWHTLLVTTDADAAAIKLAAGSEMSGRPGIVSISDAAASFRRGIALHDPDGHALQLRAR